MLHMRKIDLADIRFNQIKRLKSSNWQSPDETNEGNEDFSEMNKNAPVPVVLKWCKDNGTHSHFGAIVSGWCEAPLVRWHCCLIRRLDDKTSSKTHLAARTG